MGESELLGLHDPSIEHIDWLDESGEGDFPEIDSPAKRGSLLGAHDGSNDREIYAWF